MEEKQTTINRLYALRAGMSLLAMQYDKYYSAMYDTQKLYLEMSETYKNILEGKLHKSQHKYFDHIVDFPRLGTDAREGNYACGNNSIQCGGIRYRDFRYDFKEYQAENPEYWLHVLGQVCFFNLEEYWNDHKSVLKHYESFSDLIKQYQSDIDEAGRIVLRYDFNKWKKSFDKESIQLRIARDFLVEATSRDMERQDEEFRDDLECWTFTAQDWIKRFVGGQWLFTEEAHAHCKTKLKELNMVVDEIRSDTEELRPKGLAKIFNKNKNEYEIKRNEKAIELGLTAVSNMKNAIAFLENEIPKEEEFIEEKMREAEEAKSAYLPIMRALQAEFSDILDKRDWSYVDLVIYYFESGRADTLKEALLQVDSERRANRIVDTIKEASRSICMTLKTGFAMLNNTLQQGFAAIESRIMQQNVLLAKQNELMTQQNGLLAQQNAKIAELVSVGNMSNALLAKQNESSEQLVDKMTNLERAIVA